MGHLKISVLTPVLHKLAVLVSDSSSPRRFGFEFLTLVVIKNETLERLS